MSRKKHRKARQHRAGLGSAGARITAVIRVDAEPVRRKARKAYERVRKRLEDKRSLVARFEEEDIPLYRQWVHVTFGALLTELRDLQGRSGALRREICEIEACADEWGCSCAKAWQRMQRGERPRTFRDDAGAEDPDGDDSEFDGGGNPFEDFDLGEEERDNAEDPMAQFARMLFEMGQEMYGEPPPELRAAYEAFMNRKGPDRSPPDQRLKTLYRELVRRLHPDGKGVLSPMLKALWHETQEAYRRKDLEALELLKLRLDLEAGDEGETTSVSLLQGLTQALQRATDECSRLIRRHKQDPAWGFRQLKDRSVRERMMRLELEREKRQLTSLVAALEGVLSSFKRVPKPRQRRRPPPPLRNPGQMDLPF